MVKDEKLKVSIKVSTEPIVYDLQGITGYALRITIKSFLQASSVFVTKY